MTRLQFTHTRNVSSVKTPAEAILDSRWFINQSTMGNIKARELKTDSHSFDTDVFLQRALLLLGGRLGGGQGGRPLQWDKLGRLVLSQSRRVPTLEYMYVLSCSLCVCQN